MVTVTLDPDGCIRFKEVILSLLSTEWLVSY